MTDLHEDPIVRAAVEATALRARMPIEDVWSAARDISKHFEIEGADLAEAIENICFQGKAPQ